MQEKILEIVKSACAEQGVSLYDLQWKTTGHGRLLLVKITKLSGVTVRECQRVSRKIDRELEESDIIEGRYFLEVSSPGLERELTRKSHFTSAINEMIKLTIHEEPSNRRLKGILKEVLPNTIIIETEDGEEEEIEIPSIRKAKTLFDAKADLKNSKQRNKE